MFNQNNLFLSLKIGSIIVHEKSKYIITNFIDINNILGKNLETGNLKRLKISELKPEDDETNNDGIKAPATAIKDEDWNLAMRRYEIILPLLRMQSRTKTDVKQRAKECGVSTMTIYRWISMYNSTGLVSSLTRQGRADKGRARLSDECEKIMQKCITEIFLSKQRYSIPTLIEQITMQCKNNNIEAPHPNTIRNRISFITEQNILKARRSNKEAREKFTPILASFPDGNFPLEVIQIDHTPMDIIIVDEINRLPIGRAWITLAIDIFSRMVCGFYISLDPPSTMSVALCIAHAILPKEKWLANRDINMDWPIWGVPNTIHVDNAREFRGNALKRACQEYGITLTWRPVATPHYGGHIERYLGDLMKHIHEIPGSTFSNPSERGEYDSDAKAIMTLKELEKWITIHILGRYHQRIHSQIGMSPIKKLEEGMLGDSTKPGIGLPPRILNEDRLLLDFMPFVERTIQNYGVMFENICYYSNVLRTWINSTDPANQKNKRKFTFRYDPRDISKLYFLDPELNVYYPVPYRTTYRPVINIWEARESYKKAKESNKEINEEILFQAYEQLREIERNAQKTTKAIRRAAQRKLDTKSRKDCIPSTDSQVVDKVESRNKNKETHQIVIQAFDDIDEDITP